MIIVPRICLSIDNTVAGPGAFMGDLDDLLRILFWIRTAACAGSTPVSIAGARTMLVSSGGGAKSIKVLRLINGGCFVGILDRALRIMT